LKDARYKEKIFRIMQDIKAAEATGNKAEAKKLMEKFQKIMDEMKDE